MERFVCAAIAAVLLTCLGCGGPAPSNRIIFPDSSIHGRASQLIMDTGSSSSVLFAGRAKALGLKFDDITESTAITIADQTFNAPLPVFRFAWYFRPFLTSRVFSADGLIGWPEVRRNILMFDGQNRTVRALGALPPETAQWTKLRVIPNDWLLLEIPLDDGKTGTMEVDTGSPFGIEMVPDDWKKWRAANMHSSTSSHLGGVLSFGFYRVHAAWADEYKFGPVTLTNVAVENMPASQGDFILRQAPKAKKVWSIGLYALTRMDLIVDGKNGWAYVRPKPTPAPPYPGLKRPGDARPSGDLPAAAANWSVTRDVRVSGDNLVLLSGNIKSARRQFKEALADYNYAIELNPENADAYSRRGVVEQIDGDFRAAISDYEKVIALKPEGSDWERLYRSTLLARASLPPEDFSKSLAACKEGWTRTVGMFLSGKIDEKALKEAAKKSDGEPVEEQKGLSLFYIAMTHLSKGDISTAAELLKKYRVMASHDDDEYQFCLAELARLKVK